MAANEKWIVNVPVATIWTKFDSARGIDRGAVTNPTDLNGWLSGLTYETRLDLCESNRVQSQLLFGEEVKVLEEKDGWAHIIAIHQPSSKDERGYPGWVPMDQLSKLSAWDVTHAEIAVVNVAKAKLIGDSDDRVLLLSYQTILPVLEKTSTIVKVQTPIGTGFLKAEETTVYPSAAHIPVGSGKAIIAYGEQFLGLPYLWGGMSSYGYDCSGFSYNMCKANGVIIPRDAHDQAESGEKVELDQISPGDLLFFAYEEGKGSLHHVGIYYGDGKMLHSPNTGKTIEIISLAETVYEKELCAARRYWQETEE
ncbi:C40 family peptidase [Falsibacillus albus]|uniref:Peptidase n=1 Tax=Falsibacillus albus TaxID=2478915 RepID=A0A3L7JU94_9BACI|nr:C40 family peptidase [Falsibacillus albus]RLQ94306.1 peptidase [Falsibacillus albus]